MGYDISLLDSFDTPVRVDRHEEGGNSVIGGTTEASISITYNYSNYFHETIDGKLGIRWLYDRQSYTCFHKLQSSIEVLGTYRDDDYWDSTPGNAGHVLSVLLKWAKQYPNAVFMGD